MCDVHREGNRQAEEEAKVSGSQVENIDSEEVPLNAKAEEPEHNPISHQPQQAEKQSDTNDCCSYIIWYEINPVTSVSIFKARLHWGQG